jgi:hypothetical protein
MPMSGDMLEEIMKELDLSRCFIYDASRRSIPLRPKKYSSKQSVGKLTYIVDLEAHC